MIYCYLIHCYIHNRTVTSLYIMSCLNGVIRWRYYLWGNILPWSHNQTTYSTALFFLYFFTGLKYWRQQTLILHKWTIMMIFSNCYSTYNATCNIIFYVAIKCLMLTVFYFKVCKISSWMLSCKRSFFHINIMVLFFFFDKQMNL